MESACACISNVYNKLCKLFGSLTAKLIELGCEVTEFDEALWGGLVDHMTIHTKDNIVFTLTSGMEIKV